MLLTPILLLAVNNICFAVNSSFLISHFVDLSGIFSVYLYNIDYLSTKAHFTTISLFIYGNICKLVCSSFFQFIEILRNYSLLRRVVLKQIVLSQ